MLNLLKFHGHEYHTVSLDLIKKKPKTKKAADVFFSCNATEI